MRSLSRVIKRAPLAAAPIVLDLPRIERERPASKPSTKSTGPAGGAEGSAESHAVAEEDEARRALFAEREAVLEEARREAERLIDEARARVERLEAEARERIDALARSRLTAAQSEGYERGFAAGEAAGRAAGEAAYAARLEALRAAQAALEAEYRAALEAAVPALIRLSLAAAERVIRRRLSDDAAWAAYVQDVVLSSPLVESVTISVSPDDYARLLCHRAELEAALPPHLVLRLLPDADVRSGVRVTTEAGIVDGTIERQLERLAAELLDAAVNVPKDAGGHAPEAGEADGGHRDAGTARDA